MERRFIDYLDYREGLKYATALACHVAETGEYSKIVFVTITNQHKKLIEEILADYPVQKLKDATRFVGCNINFIVGTIKNYYTGPRDIAIYCGMDSKEIMKVEERRGIEWGIAVKEYGSIVLWGGTWGVKAFNMEGLPQRNDYSLVSPGEKIQNALRQMSNSINLTNNLSFQTTDDDYVKFIIRTLFKYEPHPLNVVEMQSFVIRECHWSLSLSDIMIDYVDKLNNGKRFQGGIRKESEMKAMYNQW